MPKSNGSTSTERGSSLLAVIGLMAVAGIATIAIAGSTLTSVGVTSATRAGVQAQAAAEAGIDTGQVQLNKACPDVVGGEYSTLDPEASIVFSHLESGSEDWLVGCPTATGQVKMISTGTAADLGVGGNSTGNTRTVEAVYAYTGLEAATPGTTTIDCKTAPIMGTTNAKFGFALQIAIAANGQIVCKIQRLFKRLLIDVASNKMPTVLSGTPHAASGCDLATIQTQVTRDSSQGLGSLLGAPFTIDARACTGGVSLTGSANSLVLKGNVEIWAPQFTAAPGFALQGRAGSKLVLITDYLDTTGSLRAEMERNGWKDQVTVAVSLNIGTSGIVTPGTDAVDGKLGVRISIRDLNG